MRSITGSFAVIVSSFALASAAGCAAPPTLPQGASLDGTYSVELGEMTGIDGKLVPGSAAKQTWAIRSACRESGCVATVAALAGGDPAKPPAYTAEFDFVDGKWIGVREAKGVCTTKKDAPSWITYSLEANPAGVLTGKQWEIFSSDSCVSNRTVTIKRTGDVNPAVALADPETLPAVAESPAVGFHGRYRDKLTDKVTGETTSDSFYDVSTYCLRTGTRCVSSLVGESRKSTLAYVFADAKWVMSLTPFPIKCDDGRDAQRTRTGELSLPEQDEHPFAKLTGTARSVDTGSCALTTDLDVTLERAGDSKLG